MLFICLDYSYFSEYDLVFLCYFDLHFLMADSIEQLSMPFLTTCASSLEKRLCVYLVFNWASHLFTEL